MKSFRIARFLNLIIMFLFIYLFICLFVCFGIFLCFATDAQHDEPHGRGTMRYSNGDSFEGNFIEGVVQGSGEYTFKNGDKYIGEYQVGNSKCF